MPTVINNPQTTEDSGSNLLVGIILIVVFFGGIALFFIYGLPMIQNNYNQKPDSTNIQITIPAETISPTAPTK